MPFVPFYPEAVRQQTATPAQQVCDSREHRPDRRVVRSGGPFVWECPKCELVSLVRIKPIHWQGANR